MKTRIEVTFQFLLVLILLSLLLGSIITLSCLLTASIKAAEKDYISAIVGSLGNIIGGIIGAIVAYLVAAYQVKKTLEFERFKGNSGNFAYLRLIKVELVTNNKILLTFKSDYFQGKVSFLDQISNENWNKCSTNLGTEVNDATLSALNNTYRQLTLLKEQRGKFDSGLYDGLLSEVQKTLEKVEGDLKTLSVS